MHVFMCLDELVPHFGPGTLVATLAPALQRAGHDVTVFVEAPVAGDNQYRAALEHAGIRVHTPPRSVAAAARWARLEAALLLALLPVRLPLALLDSLFRHRSLRRSWQGVRGRLHELLPAGPIAQPLRWHLARSLARAHRRRPADLVHMLTGNGSAFAWAARRGIPLVYTENIVPSPAYGVDWWHDVRRHVGDVRLTISVCAAAQPAIRTVLGYAGPVVVVPYGIRDPAGMRSSARARDAALAGTVIVGAAGRLTPVKGFDLLLHALARVRMIAPGAALQLWIAGDGPERAPLEALAASLDLDAHVRFLGHCGPAAMAGFWAAIDLFVLASRWEGLPFVILEAMAHAKPVIATTVDGIPEAVVDGETGVLVPPAQVDPLAQALHELISDPARRRTLGTGGRARFQSTFRDEVMLERLVAAYRQALSDAA